MIKLLTKLVVVITLISFLFGCNDDDEMYYDEPNFVRSQSSMEIASSPTMSSDINKSEFESSSLNITERKVRQNAQLDISVKSLPTTTEFINQIVDEYEGYIVNSTSFTPNTGFENKWSRISIRIPSVKLNQFLDELISHSDEIERQSIYTQDITEQYIDIKAKIKSLESSENRLKKLLNQTDSVNEIIQIEKELSRLRSEIDSLNSRFNLVENSVITSLVEIYIKEIPNPISIDDPSWDTREIALDAIKALSSLGQFLIQIIIFLFVFTPVWILIAGIIYGTSRLRKKSK